MNSVYNKNVILAGATGLVGSECLDLLIKDDQFTGIILPLRRGVQLNSAKVKQILLNYDNLEDYKDEFTADAVICALGTTIKKAGSKKNFRKVDFEYPLQLAKFAFEKGAKHFLLVSAIGADSNSFFFYNRVKGEIENEIMKIPFEKITIVRPSLLLGERSEKRSGEELAKKFNFLIPDKYKGIHAKKVALTLVNSIKEDFTGIKIIESSEMNEMHRSYV